MPPSIEESIQRLKLEILSQDWRLSPQRAAALAEALACLQQRFANRRAAAAILTMATNVLAYVERHGDRRVPQAVDFLKEAMAHVVAFYEESTLDPEEDRRILAASQRRFQHLKERIQQAHRRGEDPVPQPEGAAGDVPPATQIEPLITELKECLQRAEATAGAIRRLLKDTLAAHGSTTQAATDKEAQAVLRPCPPTPVYRYRLGQAWLGLAAERLAAQQTLAAGDAAALREEGGLCLRHLARSPFARLDRILDGPLARLGHRRLKELTLPLLAPEGNGLATADDQARHILVVGHGQHYGILLCSEADTDPVTMVSRQDVPENGDLAGRGTTADGQSFHLLRLERLLHRQGLAVGPLPGD